MERIKPSGAPLVAAGAVYVVAHATLVVASGLFTGGEPTALISGTGASYLVYIALVAAFGATLTLVAARTPSWYWRLGAGGLLCLFVAVRYAGGFIPGLLSTVVIFTTVFLPYLVVGALLVRVVIVRVGPPWFRQLPRSRATLRSVLLIGVVLFAVTGGSLLSVATAPPAVPPSDWSDDRQLAYLERTDQADRRTGAVVDRSRDYRRAERVLSLVTAGRVDSPIGQKRAAIVLQHGTCPAHYELAYRLATAANESSAVNATSRVRVTYDRWQLSIGNEQRYGTQLASVQENAACRPPVPDAIDVSAPRPVSTGVFPLFRSSVVS